MENISNLKIPVRIFLITLCLILLIIASCGNEDEKIRRSEIIPEKDLVPLLTDLYLADGLLSVQPIRAIFTDKDSTENYIDVIGQHGYTKERLDKTMQYYLLSDPKKLQKLYDQVIARLSEMESRLETEAVEAVPGITNLWPKESAIAVPESGLYNKIDFEILLRDTGMYTLSFNAVVYKDDQSLNLRSTVYFWTADDTETGLQDYWNSVEMVPDGINHSYSISKNLSNPSFTHIRGMLADHDNQPGRWQKHLRITNIHLIKGSVE